MPGLKADPTPLRFSFCIHCKYHGYEPRICFLERTWRFGLWCVRAAVAVDLVKWR